MVKDKKEKERQLTSAEKHRLQNYEDFSRRLSLQGYKRSELTVGIVIANIFAFLYGVPFAIISLLIFRHLHPGKSMIIRDLLGTLLFLVLLILLIVLHELIHGLTWSLFTERHWKDIEFGFMKEYLTPYCACTCPLQKDKYIIGALMPLVVVGILPLIAALAVGSTLWLWLGIIMVMSAGGDILIVVNILKYKSNSTDILYMDHPTQAGGVIFEKG